MDTTKRELELQLARAAETRSNTTNGVVAHTYDVVLKVLADAYQATVAVEALARKEWIDARRDSAVATAEAEPSYLLARAVVAAHLPSTELPATIRTRSTDTEKKAAFQHLHEIVHGIAGTDWADALLGGDFGSKVPVAVTKIGAAIDAGTRFYAAQVARRAAADAVHPAYLAFKDVVRAGEGKSSPNYRRLRERKPTPQNVAAVEAPVVSTPASSASPSNGAGPLLSPPASAT